MVQQLFLLLVPCLAVHFALFLPPWATKQTLDVAHLFARSTIPFPSSVQHIHTYIHRSYQLVQWLVCKHFHLPTTSAFKANALISICRLVLEIKDKWQARASLSAKQNFNFRPQFTISFFSL